MPDTPNSCGADAAVAAAAAAALLPCVLAAVGAAWAAVPCTSVLSYALSNCGCI